MKQINVYFDDKEYNLLIIGKGKQTWHDFILQLINVGDHVIKQEEEEDGKPTEEPRRVFGSDFRFRR